MARVTPLIYVNLLVMSSTTESLSKKPGAWTGLMKENIQLYYGKCGIQCLEPEGLKVRIFLPFLH